MEKEILQNVKFEKAKKTSVTETIVEQIKLLISNGELQPEDKLPSQKEMELMFHVSRPTLREAISKLVAMGVVDARQGQGYYVKQVEDITIAPNIPLPANMNKDKFYELYEAKMFFESTLARLAVYNATDEEARQLMNYVDYLEANSFSDEEPSLSGNQFHQMLADCAHNPVLSDFEKSLLKLLQEYEHSFVKRNKNLFNKYEKNPHRKIAEAILLRDEATAYEESFQHVLNYMRDIGLHPRHPYRAKPVPEKSGDD